MGQNSEATKIINSLNGRKWEDPDFPTNNSSLYPGASGLHYKVKGWKRPNEISPNAAVFEL